MTSVPVTILSWLAVTAGGPKTLSTDCGLQTRIVVAYEDGRFAGFKVFGLRPDLPAIDAGLRNGYVVLAVDGIALDGVGHYEAVDLVGRAVWSEQSTLMVRRRHILYVLHYPLSPGPPLGQCTPATFIQPVVHL